MTRAQALLYMSCPFRSSTSDKLRPSPFVDAPAVARLLSARASDLSFSKVQTLAQILSAPCPTESEIEAAIEASGIPSRLDDQFPDRDPSDKEGLGEFQVNGAGRFNGGTPQFQSASAGCWSNAGTTEDRVRHKTTTADRVGFRTASNHFSELRRQGNIACEAEKKAAALTPAAERADISRCSAQPTRTRPAAGQGTLMGFLTKKPAEMGPSTVHATVHARPSKAKTATEVMKTINGLDITLKEQMAFLPAPVIPKRPDKDFILLSSSPPRRTKKAKTDAGRDDAACEPPSSPIFNAFCQAVDGVHEGSLPEPTRAAEAANGPGASAPANHHGHSAPGRKRTLGIRRSLNGWQNRGSKRA